MPVIFNNSNKQELVEFYGDQLTAIQEPNGEVYAVMNDILRNIGFDDQKIKNQRKTWNADIVISKGGKILPTFTNGGIQETACINRRYIPIALAKISITPTMKREQPEVVERLIRYQEECADVLFKHFYKGRQTVNDLPLTREEMAAYFTCMMDTFKEYTNILELRDKERENYLKDTVDSLNSLARTHKTTLQLISSAVTNKEGTVVEKPDRSVPGLKNSYTNAQTVDWLRKANENARIIGERIGKGRGGVFKMVYKSIRDGGYDIDSIYKKYSPDKSTPMISMCANSDLLRGKVNHGLNILSRQYFPERYMDENVSSNSVSMSAMMKQTPDSIRKPIDVYAAKAKIPYTKACANVYKEMNRAGNCNVRKSAKAYAKDNGYADCCNGYYIANNPDMMELFNKVVVGMK